MPPSKKAKVSEAAPDAERDSFLSDNCPPMGIYETLYAFNDTFGAFMGTEGTHPWSQGFPLTTQLEGGPELPKSVDVTWQDRFYPKAWGHPLLREAIANYYNSYYGTNITPDNIMVFAGGRPGIYSVMSFLKQHVQVRIGNAEWPAYLDILTQTETDWKVVPFTKENGFHPSNATYFDRTGLNAKTHLMPVISNPGNPTGHTRSGAELEELMAMAEQPKNGILLDEAYEMFHSSKGVSGLQYVKDLDNSNVFLSGACTKGLQCPGIRIGWMVASKKNIQVLSNFSSFGMGGVSHPSQLYAVKLLEPSRVQLARDAIEKHYSMQRERYRAAFQKLKLTVYTGDGGFYHWCELPEGLNADEFNKRLFVHGDPVATAQHCALLLANGYMLICLLLISYYCPFLNYSLLAADELRLPHTTCYKYLPRTTYDSRLSTIYYVQCILCCVPTTYRRPLFTTDH